MSASPDKSAPFAPAFTALGVVIDLGQTQLNVVVVRRKQERVAALVALAQAASVAGSLSAAEAATLRGRLIFADSQRLGRFGTLASRAVGARALALGGARSLPPGLARALRWVARCLPILPPR
eukprot:7615935-Alexandrium_andersonii.AAC.1